MSAQTIAHREGVRLYEIVFRLPVPPSRFEREDQS